jgi:hypothetical protein
MSRCSFSTLIRYGSSKVSSINAFLGCGPVDSDTGMIVAEELSFRERECFKHLAPQREENRISLLNLGRPAVDASSGKKTAHFSLLSLVVRTHSMEVV